MEVVITVCGKDERLAFQCHKKWHELRRIKGQIWVKHCDECHKDVHRVHTEQEFQEAREKGWCIAIEINDPNASGLQVSLGVPSEPF